jgi:hypothetical protein
MHTKNVTKLRVFEAFASYGGESFALKRSRIPFKVIGYSKSDKLASELYNSDLLGIRGYWDIVKINFTVCLTSICSPKAPLPNGIS